MADRFQKLYELPNGLHAVNCPLVVVAGALLKDQQTNRLLAQIKYQSVSPVAIKAVTIGVAAYDIAGRKLQGVRDYQYLDLNIQNGESFGSKKAIIFPENTTRSFEIECLTVIFADGTVHQATMPMKSLPKSETLQAKLNDPQLVKQYQLATNKEATFVPLEQGDLWCCACGTWNSGANCVACKAERTAVFAAMNKSVLSEKMEVRLATERAENEEQMRREEIVRKERAAKDAAKKKKQKKQMIIAAVIAFVVISAVVVTSKVIIPSNKYTNAVALMDSGNYEEAWSEFTSLKGYKDATEKANEAWARQQKATVFRDIKVGDYVTFGAYAGGTISWRILDVQDNKALLISRDALEWMRYHEYDQEVTWETCTLREWLNNEFISNAFTSAESSMILSSAIPVGQNFKHNTYAGNATTDRLFLLSIREAEEYFDSQKDRCCEPTSRVWQLGANKYDYDYCTWWLRSPGSYEKAAARVSSIGAIDPQGGSSFATPFGSSIWDGYCGVRPAMWIDLSE